MGSPRFSSLKQFLLVSALLAVVLGFLCRQSFQPEQAHFSNDGRLGIMMTEAFDMPEAMNGMWFEYWWLGTYAGEAPPTGNLMLLSLLGPVWFAKLLVPVSMLFLGLCAWILFRQLKATPGAAIVAALAMALNSNLFSNACWGLGTRAMTVGFFFLAIAALSDWSGKRGWIRVVLGGFATGMGVMEGADNGVILSLYVAAFVVFKTITDGGFKISNLVGGFSRMLVVVVCAVAIAMHTMISLFNAAIKPLEGATAEKRTAQEKWEFATGWSLPPVETLRVLIPGLYGYLLTTPDGGQYRGEVGRTAGWEQHYQGIPRHSGAGEYAGLFVVLMAGFGVAQSFRKKQPVFTPKEAMMVRFWAGAALVSVLLAWGRYAPFYQLIYHLPYFSTIRLPIKYMHPFHACTGILCVYGLTALARGYMGSAAKAGTGVVEQFKRWSGQSTGQDRWIVRAVVVGFAVFGLGWVFFSQSAFSSVKRDKAQEIVAAMVNQGYEVARAKSEAPRYVDSNPQLKASVQETADFAIREVALATVVFGASGALLLFGLSGWCGGARIKWFWLAAGVLVVADLGRANLPWLHYFDYKEKYQTNSLLEILRKDPWQQRIHLPLDANLMEKGGQNLYQLYQIYQGEWMQEQLPYYRVQSLDITQDPRPPVDKTNFKEALRNKSGRLWQLTNTRYLLGLSDSQFLAAMNDRFDPAKRRFQVRAPFTVSQNPETRTVSAETNSAGPFALIEFTGALPRAGLYTRWQVITNEAEELARLAADDFDPAKEVVLSSEPSIQPSPDAAPGKVTIDSYSSRLIRMKAEATAPSVLLFIERFEPAWKAYVDGQPVETLRANYLVRGVEVPAGSHTVEFRLHSDNKGIYLTVGSQILAALLLCVMLVPIRKTEDVPTAP
jgi:hypothetical protein